MEATKATSCPSKSRTKTKAWTPMTSTHPLSEYHILNKDVITHHLGQGEVGFQCQGKLQSQIALQLNECYGIYFMSERQEDL